MSLVDDKILPLDLPERRLLAAGHFKGRHHDVELARPNLFACIDRSLAAIRLRRRMKKGNTSTPVTCCLVKTLKTTVLLILTSKNATFLLSHGRQLCSDFTASQPIFFLANHWVAGPFWPLSSGSSRKASSLDLACCLKDIIVGEGSINAKVPTPSLDESRCCGHITYTGFTIKGTK